MDKEISPEIINKRRHKRLVAAVAGGIAFCALIALLMTIGGRSVSGRDIKLATADRGTIDGTISATGQVVSAFEQTITSPIASRIMEVYARSGDTLEPGTPLLLLDLEQTRSELEALTSQRRIKELEMERSRVDLDTRLSDLEMQLKVKEMTVSRLAADLVNERRLDSLGSGTGEKVRQAELAYNTGVLELSQLRKQLEGSRRAAEASLDVNRLDIAIAGNIISDKQRTLDEAKLLSPRAATLTFIADEIGRQVGAGERLAVIADLEHFKVEGQIADKYANDMTIGQRVTVVSGKKKIEGVVTNIRPSSAGGVVSFSVSLPDDASASLRPGLRTDLYVMTDVMDDCVRIPRSSYYQGPGQYDLWVMTRGADVLERRSVMLGQGGTEFVEVREGIEAGEQVALVVPDNLPPSAKKLKIKN